VSDGMKPKIDDHDVGRCHRSCPRWGNCGSACACLDDGPGVCEPWVREQLVEIVRLREELTILQGSLDLACRCLRGQTATMQSAGDADPKEFTDEEWRQMDEDFGNEEEKEAKR